MLLISFSDQSTFYITPTSEVLDFFGLSFPSCKKAESNTNEQPMETNSPTTSLAVEDIQSSSFNESSLDKSAAIGKWNRKSILLLIAFYKENFHRMCGTSVRNAIVWSAITSAINNEGFNYTKKQVENKFKYLKQKYIKKKENMGDKASGASPIVFDYFQEFNEIFGEKPSVTPTAIASSSDQAVATLKSKNIETDKEPAKKKRRVKLENEFEKWTEEYRQRDKDRKEDRDRRHKEKQELSERAINSFENMMNKLIDKI